MKISGKWKKWITIVAVVLISVSLCAVVGHLSEGFQKSPSEWELRTVNEDNLYQMAYFNAADGMIENANGANGIVVKLNDDNVLKVSGQTDTLQTIAIGTVTLDAGQSYVFDSSFDGNGKTMYMQLVAGENSYTCYTEPVKFNVSTETEFTINLIVAADYDIGNVSLKPVICVGESADDLVSFYE